MPSLFEDRGPRRRERGLITGNAENNTQATREGQARCMVPGVTGQPTGEQGESSGKKESRIMIMHLIFLIL